MRNRSKASSDEIQRHLPLRPTELAVLAALAEGPRPGIDVLDEVNATVPRRPLLGPGTLYRLMRELRQAGLIARASPKPEIGDPPRDERQAHHVLSPLGLAVLRAEVERLRRTIRLAGAALPADKR